MNQQICLYMLFQVLLRWTVRNREGDQNVLQPAPRLSKTEAEQEDRIGLAVILNVGGTYSVCTKGQHEFCKHLADLDVGCLDDKLQKAECVVNRATEDLCLEAVHRTGLKDAWKLAFTTPDVRSMLLSDLLSLTCARVN